VSPGSAIASIRCRPGAAQQHARVDDQCGQAFGHDRPDDFLIDIVIGVAKDIAEIADLPPWMVWKQRFGGSTELAGRLGYPLQAPFHRIADQVVACESLSIHAGGIGEDARRILDDVLETGLRPLSRQ
jgi:hypothetical protein